MSALRLLSLVFGLGCIIALTWLADVQQDVAFASLWFDRQAGRFPTADDPFWQAMRLSGQVSPNLTLALLIALAFVRSAPRRATILGAGVYALGPGLVVNGVLKPLSDRPRPIQTELFGGMAPVKPWWDWSTVPDGSYLSFSSGEAAATAWLVGLALLAPKAWRMPAIVAASLYCIVISGLRIAFGAHWLSDVVASLAIMMSLWALAFATERVLRPPKVSATVR
jgi:membrane-associated phospholipid phosphatase